LDLFTNEQYIVFYVMGIQSHIIATVAIKFSSKNIAFHSDSILY